MSSIYIRRGRVYNLKISWCRRCRRHYKWHRFKPSCWDKINRYGL